MEPTNTNDPHYYHRVVDCQWACPAHTDVPGYIRLIASGRYDDAYMLNRASNVFPGILGRVCDRPCEPACRRGRIEEEPVAICRLKRVAYDFKGDITARLPRPPETPKPHSVALVGLGPASLTVANDLLSLGYKVEAFEKQTKPGGAVRYNVPAFRLPEAVLDEEIGYILSMGLKVHYGHPVEKLSQVIQQFDAVFVGSGAPVGRDLDIPGRKAGDADIHIGLDWLTSIAFGHVTQTKKRVLVIGGGNTAMDCCRSAKRLGAHEVTVVAPEAFDQMLASPWEKEETLEEQIAIKNHLLPRAFQVEDGVLTGVVFTHLDQCYDRDGRWNPIPSGSEDVCIPCDQVVLAIGQHNAYPFVDEAAKVQMDDRGLPVVCETSLQSASQPKVFFGGDSAFGPKNIIWAVAHGHEAALSIDLMLSGKHPLKDRPAPAGRLENQKLGIHEWSYPNDYDPHKRLPVPHVDDSVRFKKLSTEVELGFDTEKASREAARCLNCDVQTVFSESKCIECDACLDICPVDCLTITKISPGAEPELRAPRADPNALMYISGPLETGRTMVKDEDVCLHCGLCAEKCPTGAWNMEKFVLTLRAGVS